MNWILIVCIGIIIFYAGIFVGVFTDNESKNIDINDKIGQIEVNHVVRGIALEEATNLMKTINIDEKYKDSVTLAIANSFIQGAKWGANKVTSIIKN